MAREPQENAYPCIPVYTHPRQLPVQCIPTHPEQAAEKQRQDDLEANEMVRHLAQPIQNPVWVSQDVVQHHLPEYTSYYNIACEYNMTWHTRLVTTR